MTLQYLRAARLVVGTPGNPAAIGSPAKTVTTAAPATISDTGPADFGITAGKTVTTTTPAVPNTPATPGEGLDLSELRFSFRVEHHTIQTPGSLQLRIYNLSDATASRITKEFTRVHLSAGYEGNLGAIFNGTVALTRIGRESGTDTYLDVTAVEADLAHNFAVINQTLAAGSTPNDRLAACTKALEPYGITAGYVPDLGGQALPRGRVMFGMVRDHLRDLAHATNCQFSIKGDQLNFIPAEGYLPGPAIVLNSRTGMVGLPEQTDGGINVRCLLNPAIVPGRPVQIDQKSIQAKTIGTDLNSQAQRGLVPRVAADGFYRVCVVDHEGDSRGQNWYTTATCVALKDPIPIALIKAPDQAPAEFFDQQRAAGGPTP